MGERHRNSNDESKPFQTETNESREKVNPIIKTVGVCCGYDYTIAIQPGIYIIQFIIQLIKF